jgi:hypothetical protein
MALVGGRMETSVSYDVGFTKDGIIQGVDIRAWLLRGAYPDASFDQVLVKMTTDMVRKLSGRGRFCLCFVSFPGTFIQLLKAYAMHAGEDDHQHEQALGAGNVPRIPCPAGSSACMHARFHVLTVWQHCALHLRFGGSEKTCAAAYITVPCHLPFSFHSFLPFAVLCHPKLPDRGEDLQGQPAPAHQRARPRRAAGVACSACLWRLLLYAPDGIIAC